MTIDHGTTLPDPAELSTAVDQAAAATQDNPQGAAATPAAKPQEATPSAPTPLPKLAGPGKAPQLAPLSGQDALLLGPSSRPNEPITAGVGVFSKPQPPANLGRYVPALQAAAADPEAPPLIHNLVALLGYHLGEQA